MTQRMQANTIPIISLTISSTDNDGVGDQVIDLAAYKANERWLEIAELVKESKIHPHVVTIFMEYGLSLPDRSEALMICVARSRELSYRSTSD